MRYVDSSIADKVYGGLTGLPGLDAYNKARDKERFQYYHDNQDRFAGYDSLVQQTLAMNDAYNRDRFKKTFENSSLMNKSTFSNLLNNDSAQSNAIIGDLLEQYDYGNKANIVNDEFAKRYKKQFNNFDWSKYSSMTPESKLKLMKSAWLPSDEINALWKKHADEISSKSNIMSSSGAGAFMPLSASLGQPLLSTNTPKNDKGSSGMNGLQDFISHLGFDEGAKKLAYDRNNRILENIYNDDLKQQTYNLGDEVAQTYTNDPEINSLSDDQVKKSFYENFVNKNNKESIVNAGAGTYAAYWGKDELKDFGIDDMRKALAKKKVYMQHMSPYAASQALNNEAKEYVADHQSSLTKAGLFLNDVGISAMSYTADKINGLYTAGMELSGQAQKKYNVLVDENNNIIGSKDKRLSKDKQFYRGEDGKIHRLHTIQLTWNDLHQAGKDTGGNELGSLGPEWLTLNSQYWNRAEQFGTLDNAEQKQYEQLGASPYKVAYKPNEESDLWYEAFKMASFGLADMGAQLIPFGVGTVGRMLSTASRLGTVGKALGKTLDFVGRGLTYETRFGQVSQGIAGAAGIGYAYGRGAYQDALQENMQKMDEAVTARAEERIDDNYKNNPSYKRFIDSRITQKTDEIKKQYLRQLKDSGVKYSDKELDKQVKEQAAAEVRQEQINYWADSLKNTEQYAKYQQEALHSAGNTAMTTFLPEAVKYSLVNTLGFRKFLYKNPTGVQRKLSRSLEGLTETTTADGRQRLTLQPSKFLTRGQKMKQFAKIAGGAAWNGAWTNGTDDVMTDAAERINTDSFARYTNGYLHNEAAADTYGFTDGLFSYLMGASNSMGQETTWNAAAVGALGSVVNFTPHFTNMASLLIKEGREAYRNNFLQRYKRDDNGFIQRDENGKPITENISARENWRDRLAFFVQNGVLNTYYGKKQSERDLQNHADYVNNILDDYNDFEDIIDLVASDKALDEAVDNGDKKTARFIRALQSINVLENLGNDSKDPAAMSSVVQNAKQLIETLSQSDYDPMKDEVPKGKDISNLLSQYYAMNPSETQSRWNDRQAFAHIINNAKELKKASDAYNDAEEEISKAEDAHGQPFDYAVREKLKLNQALDGHWRNRLQSMKDEIGDTSEDREISGESLISSVGGRANAKSLVKVYDSQLEELKKEQGEQAKTGIQKSLEYDKANEELENNTDEDKAYDLQQKVAQAKAAYDDAVLQDQYIDSMITVTENKKAKVSDALANSQMEEGKPSAEKILTADEIMSLDPVSRARMMNKDTRGLYSKEQVAEIEKLEKQLLMKDSDALNKIQDIATLTQRINSNEDAYSRMIQNPEAAAVRFEAQRASSVRNVYNLINQKAAETIKNWVDSFDEGLSVHKDVSQAEKDDWVYRTLRTNVNSEILEMIDKQNMLPKYQKQVKDAIEWAKTTEDLDAVLSTSDLDENEKKSLDNEISNIVEASNSREEILSKLREYGNTDDPVLKRGINAVLTGLENIGKVDDAVETPKNKKDREEENRKTIEKKKEQVKTEAEAAAKEARQVEEAAREAKEAELENARTENPVAANGEGLTENMELPENMADKTTPAKESEDIDMGWASSFMDDAAEEGSMSLGQMYHTVGGKVQKGTVSISLKKNGNGSKITITNDKTPETLSIASDDWEYDKKGTKNLNAEDAKAEGIDKSTPFIAESIEKTDDGWVFNGKFEGHDGTYSVKAKKGFNLDNAIERQQTAREADAMAEGIDTGNNNIIDNGDTVEGKSETIDEQNTSEGNKTKEQSVSTNNTDSITENVVGESNIEKSQETLTGNAMSEWKHDSLADDGKLVHKKGDRGEHDPMNKYYAWLRAADIHLQDIIDRELGQMLQSNPHMKVKFMAVNPKRGTATNDDTVQNHLFLVVDYDNKVNKDITLLHEDDNGGVIDANGKKYLIIGVAGYYNNAMRDLYDILYSNSPKSTNGYGIVRIAGGKYFNEHPDERFYVHEGVETEIVPHSLIPGYIVKQLEGENSTKFRPITEILDDDKRNPLGLSLDDLNWGIQEWSKFLIVGTDVNNAMIPRNIPKNIGSAFVLIPASNGKFVPAYLKPLFYADDNFKDGALKNRVNELLNLVTSPNYKTRLTAIIDLCGIFHFDKDGENILTTKPDRPASISLVKEGNVFRTFSLNEQFDKQAFLDAFKEMNPRINITAKVLQTPDMLREWAEAGALDTDVALLATAGSSYSIYGVDSEGKMLGRETTANPVKITTNNSDYKNDDKSFVIYKSSYYTYSDGQYSINGKTVTDDMLLQQLEYNRQVVEQGLMPTSSEGLWGYYVLKSGDNPEVVAIQKNTKEVEILSKEAAAKYLEKIKKEEENRKRREAAAEANQQVEMEDVDLGEIDYNTGEQVIMEEQRPAETTAPSNSLEANKNTQQKESANPSTNISRPNPNDSKYNRNFVMDREFLSETDGKEGSNIKADADGNFIPSVNFDNLKSVNSGSLKKFISIDTNGTTMKEAIGYEILEEGKFKPTNIGSIMEVIKKVKIRLINPKITLNSSFSRLNSSKAEGMSTIKSNEPTTQSFIELYNKPKHKIKIFSVIKKKWKDAPMKEKELTEYLRKKNIEVDAIGTSKEAVQAWMKTIEDCR